MGTQERKEKEKLMRREAIIDAAKNVFAEKGFKGATMEDIAVASDFTKKTVYAYFSSKDELYSEMMRNGFEVFNDLINAQLKYVSSKSEIDKIRLLGRSLLQFAQQYPDYFEAIMEYENKLEDLKAEHLMIKGCYEAGQYSIELLHQTVLKGIEKGEIISEPDAASTTLMLWACLSGAIRMARKKAHYIKEYYQIDEEKVVEDTIELLMKAIKKHS